ncbi:siderophore-interacting protein [Enemella sp. A6]|uniref:siderophore-interacting protein n=1 Tax=Enemella sp. A6 TaxID=3440152 RepID=UPI003EBDB7BB
MQHKEQARRMTRRATVRRTERLSPDLVRVVFTGPDIAALPELRYTDHYIKIIFGDATRTYTIRSLDRDRVEMAVDFVVHGSAGLAGPWAASAKPGDEIEFRGPGGAWAPDPEAELHLLVGDEAALPAIAAALERLPDDAAAEVFVEVTGPDARIDLPGGPDTRLHWVHRGDRHPGLPLSQAVQQHAWRPEGLSAFVHGNADMIKDLRRFLFVDCGVPREQVSISGYWRTGLTEDDWQASKREFVAEMEREELVASGSPHN